MDKTLHKKLTEKRLYRDSQHMSYADGGDMLASLRHEMNILHFAAKDLLQPRAEAIAGILEKARVL